MDIFTLKERLKKLDYVITEDVIAGTVMVSRYEDGEWKVAYSGCSDGAYDAMIEVLNEDMQELQAVSPNR